MSQVVADNFRLAVWRYCLLRSLPVAGGYIFLGFAFGVYFTSSGWHPVWALAASLFVYAGSLQFALVALLAAGVSAGTIALASLLINARHLFYGLSLIEPLRAMNWKKLYVIFGLTDETYSLLCSVPVPEGMQRGEVYFCLTVLNHCYWLGGTLAGTVAGNCLPVDFAGIEFSMTGLFAVIVLEQWRKNRQKLPVAIGFASGLFFLLLLGPQTFLLPSLAVAVALLFLLRAKISSQEAFVSS